MKRKAPISQDESSKRRKQDPMDISNEDNDNDSAQVRSIHAELSALKTREIADISGSIASIPHMTFGKRPIKLKSKPTSTKPGSTNKPNASSSTTKSSSIITPPTPLPDQSLTQKQSQLERAKSAARRSSFGQRGKRAKGSFEQGESVMPHESVRSEMLYRHIDTELPEPVRARGLLVWCARRAANGEGGSDENDGGKGKGKGKGGGKSKGKVLNDADSALLASIQDRIVRQLMDLTIDIPLYDVSGGPFADLGKGKGKGKKGGKEEELVEDPVNMKNREVKERLAKAEERARDEDAMWSKVIQDYNSLQSTVLSTLSTDPPSSTTTKSRRASEYDGKSRNQTQQIFDVRLSELDEKWREVDEELETYRREVERGSEMDKALAKRCKMLPLQLDSIRQNLARSTAFTEQAKGFIDNLFTSIDLQAHPPLQSLGHFQPSAKGGNTNANANSNEGGSKPLPGLFAALSIASSSAGGGGAAGVDSADLFRALAKNDGAGRGAEGGYGDGGAGEMGVVGGVVTSVQPATPRRMPGTPRRGGPDANGGGGGSALRRG